MGAELVSKSDRDKALKELTESTEAWKKRRGIFKRIW